MLLPLASIVVGFILLIWGADRFVFGAANTARYFGVSPLIVGITIVGFGTSAPEMMVSAISAWQGSPGIALGNAYGSNITNIALVLGATAIISPITVSRLTLRRELPLLLALTILTAWMLRDGVISRIESIVLLVIFFLWMGWTIYSGMQGRKAVSKSKEEIIEEVKHPKSILISLFWVFLGLALLAVSSQILVWGAVKLAKSFGVSDLVIGLTIIAVGTSLPELASSVIAARQGEHDIALGNVVGSNLFNMLAVIGIAGVISPISATEEVLTRDVLLVFILTAALIVFGYKKGKPGKIGRLAGCVLLTCYISYNVYLFLTAFS